MGLSRGDRTFLAEAAMGCLAQLRVDQIGTRRGVSLGVKNLAQRIWSEDDHLQDEVSKFAARKGVRIPTALDSAHLAPIDRLSQRPSAGFDRAFARVEVNRLQRAVALFEHEAAAHGSDPEVVHFAFRKLTVVRRHLTMAQTLATTGTF
jgi:predicted outer membrane protein